MDADEFKRAFSRHGDMVFRIAYTYMRSPADADDVTQDVFVKLLKSQKSFESDAHLRNWLARVAVNRCKSLFRAPWRRVEDIEDYIETLAVPTKEHRDLLLAVMRLPEKYRVPMALYYYGGFSTGEVADLINVPAATVRTRLARGRDKLRQAMESEETR